MPVSPTSAPPSVPGAPAEIISAPSPLGNDAGKGIAFMLLGVGIFAIMDALVKWLGETYPTIQLVFFRSLFAFLPLSIVLIPAGIRSLKTTQLRGHMLRSIIGLSSMFCFFYSYSRMQLADAIAIGFAAPLFVTALSVPMLREAVGIRRWSAVIIGFIGTLIMASPTSGVFAPITIICLVGTFFYAVAMMMIRLLSRTENPATIVFYFTLTCTLVSGAMLPFVWITPPFTHLCLLMAVGILGGSAQLAITHAFRAAPPSVIAPFDYTAMIYATIIGWMVWGELPKSQIWVGAVIVVASGLYILFRETKLKDMSLPGRKQSKV